MEIEVRLVDWVIEDFGIVLVTDLVVECDVNVRVCSYSGLR